MTHFTHDNWSTWFEHLSSPLSENRCGEDLKYEEDFKYLKTAFSGVNELDCKKVFVTGTSLLSEKSKDLRIVSYVLCASANDFGLEGVTFGLNLFNHYVGEYFKDVHPIKAKAKAAVHTWLLGQQGRIIALCETNKLDQPEQIVALLQALKTYSLTTVRALDENAGPLSDLKQWAEKLSKKFPVVEKVEKVEEVETQPVNKQSEQDVSSTQQPLVPQIKQAPEPVVQQPVVVSTTVDSDSQYNEMLRKLLAFDKDNSNLKRLIAMSRAARWSDIKLPPNENGKTRIPAPRNTALAPIKNALANDEFMVALNAAEGLFMEGAMHFNLDLQVMVLAALQGLNQKQAVSNLELSLYQVLINFPKLTNLSYDDGTPFCSANSKEKLNDIAEKFSGSGHANNDDDMFSKIEGDAKALVADGKLEQALALVNTLPSSSQFETGKQTLIKAKLCLAAERYDFAAPMLSSLVELVERSDIGQWQQSFSMQVWRSAVVCFDTLSEDSTDEHAVLSQQLKKKMILTQPEVALGWI